MKNLSFQDIILNLFKYWSDYGCSILQPIDLEVGAGTLHHATILRALDDKNWNVIYTQPCRRPNDARYARNPNRLGYYYQMQVLLKPIPNNIQEIFLKSLEYIGIDIKKNDIRFVEDNWENPTVGAAGLGWEIWCNGMEIVQYTYMQQVGGIECKIPSVEITYGLERIATYIQGVDSIFDINWNGKSGSQKMTYSDVFLQHEIEQSSYIKEHSNVEMLFENFELYVLESENLLLKNLAIPSYEFAIKASHILNLLDAKNILSTNERMKYMMKIRELVNKSCQLFLQKTNVFSYQGSKSSISKNSPEPIKTNLLNKKLKENIIRRKK